MGFHVLVATHEDLSTDVSISYWCRTDFDEAKVISFLREQTDRVLESSHGNMPGLGTQKISTQSSKLGLSCQSLYASSEDGDG